MRNLILITYLLLLTSCASDKLTSQTDNITNTLEMQSEINNEADTAKVEQFNEQILWPTQAVTGKVDILNQLSKLSLDQYPEDRLYQEREKYWQEQEKLRIVKKEKEDKARIQREKYTGKMVLIPAGHFMMGSNKGLPNQKPVHYVSVPAFFLSEQEVTFEQWDACVADGGCSHKPTDRGWGRGNRPVFDVSYDDITMQFIPWLNKKTKVIYRLPTEAEWEYAARAGSTSKYYWGNAPSGKHANGAQFHGWPDDGYKHRTAPVKSFIANTFGLYDMLGNVSEWNQDCWNNNYQGAPSNGEAWLNGNCKSRIMRGGAWNSGYRLRLANREKVRSDIGNTTIGFRLARNF